MENDELSRCFSGVALMFVPTQQLRRRARVSPGSGRFFSELWTGKSAVLFLAVAGALSQLLGSLSPALKQVLVDEMITPRRSNWLMPILFARMALARPDGRTRLRRQVEMSDSGIS